MNNKEKECFYLISKKSIKGQCSINLEYCDDTPDCYYKQLQTTKQQLEEANKRIYELENPYESLGNSTAV